MNHFFFILLIGHFIIQLCIVSSYLNSDICHIPVTQNHSVTKASNGMEAVQICLDEIAAQNSICIRVINVSQSDLQILSLMFPVLILKHLKFMVVVGVVPQVSTRMASLLAKRSIAYYTYR